MKVEESEGETAAISFDVVRIWEGFKSEQTTQILK
jgi:hypothetical protein